MKILLVSEYFPPKIFGGGEISAALLAKNLSREGIEVSVLTSHFNGLKKFEVKDGVKIYRRLKTGENPSSLVENLKRKLLFPYSLKKDLQKIAPNYDVIHFLNTTSIVSIKTNATKIATINSYGNFCPKSNLFYRDREICDGGCTVKKFILCILSSEYAGKVKLKRYLRYNPLFWLLSYWNYKRRKKNLKSIDKFIAISDFVKKQLLKEGISEKKIAKIPNLVEIKDTKEEYSLNKKGIIITYIGALEKIKGVSLLIKAFNEIPADATLLIVGDGSEKENLEKLANKKVKFLGKINYKFMPSIYQQSDIIVLPSLWPEPLSRVLLEALYFGKPIVATNVGGNPECVIDGKNGFLVEPEIKEIKEKLDIPLEDSSLRERMGRESKKIFQERFKAEEVIEKILKVYKGD